MRRCTARTHLAERRALRTRCTSPGPGTDLTVGLADGHEWQGGASTAKNGITCNPNIPTEEVFTTPHARRVEGHVSSTKPLSYQGTLIDEISGAFRGRPDRRGQGLEGRGRAEEGARHRRGRTRASAKWRWCRIPRRSPRAACCSSTRCSTRTPPATSRSASATRNASSTAPRSARTRSRRSGGNKSLIHIDWMIGSDKIDIDGVHKDGRKVPVMRKGECA